MRRNCCEVINQMLEKIPADKVEFIKDLEWNYEDASCKAPEETIQWDRTSRTLIKHMSEIPKEDWEIEVFSIFSMLSVEQIKKEIKNLI